MCPAKVYLEQTMAGSDLRRRLERMNGGPLAEAAALSEGTELPPRDLAQSPGFTLPYEILHPQEGETCVRIRCPLARMVPEPWAQDAARCLTEAEGTVCMDLETLGLNFEPLFLVGLLSMREGEPVLTQYLARTYSEEPAVIRSGIRALRSAVAVATFNGLSFDIPYLSRRAGDHGIPPFRIRRHRDVLLEARQRWAGRFRSFRLTALEQQVLGRIREHDLPGAAAPQAWRGFVETGDAGPLTEVLRHNAMDLAGTASLMGRVSQAV
jgi:uncharacterized protein YprB with RNaseH-like and TPR domain